MSSKEISCGVHSSSITGQTLGAYEAGRRRIPMKHALKLCPYGIPLDWIYQGQVTNLHPHIRDKIREH